MQILNRLNLNLDSFCMSQFLFPIHLSSLISKSIYLPTWGFAFLSFFSLRTPFCSKPSFSCHTSITLSTLFASFFYSLFPLQPIFLPALIHFKIPPHTPPTALFLFGTLNLFTTTSILQNHPNQGNRVLKLCSSGVHSPTCSIPSTKVSDRFRL